MGHEANDTAYLDVEPAGRGMDPWGNERIGFVAKTSVDRRDAAA